MKFFVVISDAFSAQFSLMANPTNGFLWPEKVLREEYARDKKKFHGHQIREVSGCWQQKEGGLAPPFPCKRAGGRPRGSTGPSATAHE